MNRFKIPIGQKSEIEAGLTEPTDPKERLNKLGVTKEGARADKKWDSIEEAEPEQKALVSADGEYIDPAFFSLDFVINGKAFTMAVDHILRIKQEELTDPSIESFNSQLEACSYYRFSFFAAAQQIMKKRKEVERAFRQWMAKRQDHQREILSKARKQFREKHSLSSKDQPSITKDEVLDAILIDKDDGPIYETFQDDIDVMKQKEDLLMELRDCLHDRGFHLGGIADRMSQHRSKGDF